MKKILVSLTLVLAMLLPCAALAETVSVTTGLPIEKENKTIVCQFDNEPGARPQCGIAGADVVYETEVYNGGYTRYTAVFNDTIPELVEAVRSARMLHLDLYQEWGGMFTCYGFQTAEGTDAQSYAKRVTDVLFNGLNGDPAFYRDEKRAAPNNVVFKMAEKYATVDQSFEEKTPFVFGDEPITEGEEVSIVEITYQKDSYRPAFSWDANAQAFVRFYNGDVQKDGYTDEQLTFQNVIVQHVNYSWYDGASNRPVAELTGRNDCDYFINGRHISGYWERDSVNTNTRYYDEAGNLIQFTRGKTFVEIVKSSVVVSWN